MPVSSRAELLERLSKENSSVRIDGASRISLLHAAFWVLLGATLVAWGAVGGSELESSYVVLGNGPAVAQQSAVEQLEQRVDRVGGTVTHRLELIGGIAADLTPSAEALLRSDPSVRLFANGEVDTAGGPQPVEGTGPAGVHHWTRAAAAHEQGVDGHGITVAVVDTGLWNGNEAFPVLAGYDAITDTEGAIASDAHGHGTLMSSLIAGPRGIGVAPAADLVVVRAFDRRGRGTYADVIRGIDWVVANRFRYGVRVLNLSFAARARSFYWEDPLALAAMRAWEAGIVVISSSGNRGPEALSIGVPGNVPYLITVGGASDAGTGLDLNDDYVSRFSSAGPTVEGFVKPDLIAPAGGVSGVMHPSAAWATDHADAHNGYWFSFSGSSAASAITSGIAALVLSETPGLSPDEVKCRLKSSARLSRTADGALAYSVFQQGNGLVDALGALRSTASGCANQDLDLVAEFEQLEHFLGYAQQDDNGVYSIAGRDGYDWDGEYVRADRTVWAEVDFWEESPTDDAYPWSDRVAPWDDLYPWSDAYPWSDVQNATNETENAYPWSDRLLEPVRLLGWVTDE